MTADRDQALLFSYGTLRQKEVQLATFGRELSGTPDTLAGYGVSMIPITDPSVVATSGTDFHPILRPTGNAEDRVDGTVFEVTPSELARADEYEVEDYTRVEVELVSGRRAFVYLAST